MNSPRVRRLESDYKRISTLFAGWPLIQVELADGQPPDMYRIWYNLKGLFATGDGRILERDEHVLEIRLGLEYPRRAPQLRLLTPLFHPNFNNTDVCAQDIYAASEGLDDLIIRIGRMIAYQEYNTKSPLNGIAAKWAAENSHRLPVDGREIAPLTASSQSTPPPLPQQSPQTENDDWENQIVIGKTELVAYPEDIKGESIDPIQVATPPQPAPSNTTDLRFACLHCNQRFEADAQMQGAEIQCPSCQNVIIVPNCKGDRLEETW
jgi:ubiquitin-protein ligase/DNA-directed RNA polymerase subunit RPC12/RpoP